MDNKKFLKDLQELPIEELVLKYNLSLKELFELSKKLYTHTDGEIGDKYITKTPSKSYMIMKSVAGKNVYFGSYKDLNEARVIRDELIECGWDIEELPRILDEFNIKSKCTKEW